MANDILVTFESLKTILPVVEDHILDEVRSVNAEVAVTEPLDGDIPMVFITGNIPETKDYVEGELEYVSKGTKFHAYTYIKLQGNSSLQYDKKNFTVNLYSDESCSVALNKEFKNWGAHNNFVLKADYIDITHARNVVCANLWSKVVQSRPDYDDLPEELKESPNNGAIDGFPIKVYINGYYEGLYNWTIPKCDWQFGMAKNNPNHAVLGAEVNDNGDETLMYNPCNFSAYWDGVDGDYWSVEVGDSNETVTDSFNAIVDAIEYLYATDDVTALESVLDIQSAIDYFIFQDVIFGIDGLAKNMLIATYDITKWYLSAYDMDSTFDLYWDGSIMDWFDAWMTDGYDNQYSQLLLVIWDYYWDRMVERYWELRQTVLSEASIISAFEAYIGQYGDDLYIQDTVPYPDIPSATTNNLTHLRYFIADRLWFLDNNVYYIEEVE